MLNRPYMYTNTVPPRISVATLYVTWYRGSAGRRMWFLPGHLPGRTVCIGLFESVKLTWSVLPGTSQSVMLPIGAVRTGLKMVKLPIGLVSLPIFSPVQSRDQLVPSLQIFPNLQSDC